MWCSFSLLTCITGTQSKPREEEGRMPGLERGEFPARGDPKGFSENDNGGRNYPLRNGDGSGGMALGGASVGKD